MTHISHITLLMVKVMHVLNQTIYNNHIYFSDPQLANIGRFFFLKLQIFFCQNLKFQNILRHPGHIYDLDIIVLNSH